MISIFNSSCDRAIAHFLSMNLFYFWHRDSFRVKLSIMEKNWGITDITEKPIWLLVRGIRRFFTQKSTINFFDSYAVTSLTNLDKTIQNDKYKSVLFHWVKKFRNQIIFINVFNIFSIYAKSSPIFYPHFLIFYRRLALESAVKNQDRSWT